MCGIAGSLGAPSVVPTLVQGLRHRGPDHQGWTRHEDLAVGAARLRVTGDARGDMPLVSESGRTVVVINGEIFNHEELFGPSPGASDTRGLPDLIERLGPAAFSLIRGPFAAVVMDREDGSLTVARDERAIRPLFIAEGEGTVTCASEVSPLRHSLRLHDHDPAGWAHLLAFQFWPEDRTLWEGLRPLPPGTWRRYEKSEAGLTRRQGRIRYEGGGEDLGAALAGALQLQGRCALRAGITLSGGLDSSAVLGGVVGSGQGDVLAATGWFPEAPEEYDERPWARRAAEEVGCELLEVPITAQSYLEAWPRVLRALGGPVAGPGAVSQWLVCAALADAGVGVVYSGQGGDELFGGYERHRLLLQRDLGLPLTPAPGYERLLDPGATDPAAAVLFRGGRLLPLLEPEMRARVLNARRSLPVPGPGLADRLLEFEVETLLPGLLAVDDRTTAAFGMEGRVPLLDPALARLALRMPLREKSPPDASRRAFRVACDPFLPDGIKQRKDKMGFPVPLDQWLRGPWRSVLRDHPGIGLLPDVGFRPEVGEALAAGLLRGRDAWFVLSVALALHEAGSRSTVVEAAG